jgi:hypothetical protein
MESSDITQIKNGSNQFILLQDDLEIREESEKSQRSDLMKLVRPLDNTCNPVDPVENVKIKYSKNKITSYQQE